ncbi:MAG: carbon-nitrogen hydrolase family protein [Thermomicrobiales bacterium]
MRIAVWIIVIVSLGSLSVIADEPDAPEVRFEEGFDDANLLERGWYDGRRFEIDDEAFTGSGCLEFHWNEDTTTPANSSGVRRLFEPSETVYLRFRIKLSENWGWTDRPYHPHLMHFMTTENEAYHGPAASHLTLYIEPQNGKLRLAAQDIQNQDAPHGLTQGPLRGGYNGMFYDSEDVLFTDDEWHTVEALFTLNTLDEDSDAPNADGIVRGWFDGELVVDRTDVILRSTDFPNMKFNQFLLTPYFGDGLLPHEQTLWIDDLVVATGRIETVRVAAVQAQRRLVDWRIEDPEEVLAAVDNNLEELEQIIHTAADSHCDVLAFPEDTLGLLNWYGMNEPLRGQVLPEAVSRMIDRLGQAAASHQMSLVVCSDCIESDGNTYNTAFLLGPDGQEIGRYHKTCPTWSESGDRARGTSFPVFPTEDLGPVGMLICYDLVFPETARCLALGGANVIFFPTMGGAAVGDDDIGLQALRVRAAENHVWLVVAFRGSGSMIISPRGTIIAQAEGPDGLAIADIDPRGGRRGGDAMNVQHDMRARLFRERNPAAFGMLTELHPPVLDMVPIDITQTEAGDIAARVLTIGEEEFRQAESLVREGRTEDAISAFSRLQQEYRGSWIDRVATERLRTLQDAMEQERP